MEKIKMILYFLLIIHVPMGGLHWAYISWELGSFLMFWCVCILPLSVPVGVYMMYFGIPNWIMHLFG